MTTHTLTFSSPPSSLALLRLAVMQLKWAQLEASREPIFTPFGLMRQLPPWEKGDACDMVLLFTSVATMLNWLPEVREIER